MKKGLLTLFVVLMFAALCLTGCGGTEDPATDNPATDGNVTDAPTDANNDGDAAVEPRNLKLATIATTSESMYERIQEFCQKVEEGTDGAITFTIYPADQLGDYTVVYEEVMKGNIECTVNSIPSTYDNRADALYIYYLAETQDALEHYYGPDSYLHSLMDEITQERGVKFVAFDCQGMGGLAFTKVPENYNVPGAAKNTVSRVPATDVGRIYMEKLGYTAVTVNYGDLYSAMQTGVVEGWVGGNPTLNWLTFRDVIKVYIQTNDITEMCSIMFNQEVWDSFTPEQQALIQQAGDEQFQRSLTESAEDNEMYIQNMKDYGIEIIYLTEEELKEHAAFVRENVWPAAVDTLTQEVLDGLYGDIARREGSQ